MKQMKRKSNVATRNKIVAGFLAGLSGLASGYSQQLAFPGAQGYGQYATGGRGGSVYHVTTLADSGPGSFRDAVSQGGRTIVFDVGGYIVLYSAVSASSGLTIAGQTALGDGISVMNQEVSFSGKNNIICRNMRFRQGGSSKGSSGINIGSAGSNMIFDHISVEFGQWDSIDAVNTSTFTVQNSIIADPINQQFGAHVEGGNATWIANLWVNAHNRQPLAKANTVYVNNVIYNYVSAYTTGDTSGAAYNHDIINNYFICGPNTTAPTGDFFQINGGKAQNLYFTGNLLDSDKNGSLDGNTTAPSPDYAGKTGNVLTAPWSPVTPTIPTTSATAAYRVDLSASGALPRDPLDSQVISQVASLGTAGAIITSPSQTGLANGGFGTINGGSTLTDSDQDGMPDFWEIATGSNPLVKDNNTVAADGYTLLEHYLNWLALPHAITLTNTSVNVDLSQYTGGFTSASPVYSVNNVKNGAAVLNGGHIVQFTPTKTFIGLGSFNFSVLASDGSLMTNTVSICIAPLLPPGGLATVAGNNQVALSWTASAGAVSYHVKRATLSGGPYTIIASATTTSYTDTTAVNGTTYYYVVSAVTSGGSESANSSAVSASLVVTIPIPSPWATADIGAVGVAGSATYANGLFTVKGSGADIWGTADAFRYVYQPASGDCSIQAEVLSVQNTAAWAKAGVMIRESTNANAVYSMEFLAPVTATSTNGVALQQRTSTGGTTTSIKSIPGLQAPYWVKLARTGNSFVGSCSADGINWTALGTNSLTMATNVYIGLPVCSVVNTLLNTATFTNVTAVP